MPISLSADKNLIRFELRGFRTPLIPVSGLRFLIIPGITLDVDGRVGARITDQFGVVETHERVSAVTPTAQQLGALVGTYRSDEAEASLIVAVEDGRLKLKRRPDSTVPLTPVYADAFDSPLGMVICRRDRNGRVVALSVVQDRVWDLRFLRQ